MSKSYDPKVRISQSFSALKRTVRRPAHPFDLKTRPFQLQPFLIAPVLPGETLENMVWQSRVVTDPIKNPLIGWWTEYYYFYVKHRDIEYHLDPTGGSTPFQHMVLNPATTLAGMATAANPVHFHAGGVNWTEMCLQTVTEWYFRDEAENWNAATMDGLPLAQIHGNTWMDSITLDSEKRNRQVDVDMNDDGIIEPQEIEDAMSHWAALREAGLMDMDYEDYLRTHGVAVPEAPTSPSLHRPELLRYQREWSYPTNVVDPVTGVPSSAVSWAVAGRADKKRFFKEPGFIFGLTVVRPKVYCAEQKGSLVSVMDNIHRWLPAMRVHQYEEAFASLAKDKGPLAGVFNEAYWVDIRDLLMYGDEFRNHTDADGVMSFVNADGSKRYVSAASVDALFKDAAKNKVRQDGIVNLGIAGRVRDNTPGKTL